jgi:hypothetical protein
VSREWRLAGKKVPASVVREFVFRRDGGCILRGQGHVCRDKWGNENPYALTLEHVTQVHSHLDGRKDDERHTVALCERLNGGSLRLATRHDREKMRDHLRNLYPACAG